MPNRKLPSLPSSVFSSAHIDNPTLHQGRTRTVPHVEGQYAAYVYVPVRLPRASSVDATLRKILAKARDIEPIIHPISHGLDAPVDEETEIELHISLTRPIFLRAHQREEFKSALRSIAKAHTQYVWFNLQLAKDSHLKLRYSRLDDN
ncbi:hypothetical protein PHLCEN_2v1113 [Hermanssonia centrifuga]|uniref:U6 snRNA phosphodiesterase 1 n=1 Tax=Hermanssonia centrifuga TaxID=98765 RepID=A0A2R6S455_9APHY|nr:hypothetical protein PHLCEN_2v1113 [Hermanssonia centrifuga]